MLFQSMTPEEKNKAAQELEFNVSEEALAREDYYKLLDVIADQHKEQIKGIIEDEINHSIILMKLCQLYSGNMPSEFESIINLKKREEK